MSDINVAYQHAAPFLHITLNTGHVCYPPAEYRRQNLVDWLKPTLADALATGLPFIYLGFEDELFVKVSRHEHAYLVELFLAHDGGMMRLLSFGVALKGGEGSGIWNDLHDCMLNPSPTKLASVPAEPWIASDVGVWAALNPGLLSAMGRFQVCVAWALVALQGDDLLQTNPKREAFDTHDCTSEEGAVFDFNRECPPTLTIRMENPTEEEIEGIRRGKVRFALTKRDGVIFLLAKFGCLEWLDAPFHAGLYEPHLRGVPDEWSQRSPFSRFSLGVRMIDNASGQTVGGARLVTFSPEFSNMLAKLVSQQASNPISRSDYEDAISRAYAVYPSPARMAKAALSTCLGGS